MLEPPPPPDVFVYSAKIVCVPHLGKASPALMPGRYRTAVNVHNPWDEPAHIQKWVALSPPQGQTPITGGRIADTLQPWSSFDVDCPHFRDDFWLPPDAKVPGGKGFMVIRADRELDVVAVYTSKALNPPSNNGVGTSIDVERVAPKMSKGAIARGPIHAPSGMISWWSGDDHPNDIIDGNHGTLQGGATYAPGMVEQAFSFDGIDDHVSLPSAPSANSFTIEGWILIGPTFSSWRTIYGNNFNGFWVLDRKLNWWHGDNRFIGNTTIPQGEWHHIALTYANNTLSGYLDGQADGSSAYSGAFLPTGSDLGIGGHNLNEEYFNGLIDELSIFGRALSADEIRAIYEADNAGKIKPKPIPPPSGMVSWWPGDSHPNDIIDGNDGTLQGGATYAPGMVGQAFSFDASLNSGVTVPSSANLNPTEAITIDAWVNPSSFPNSTPTVVRKSHPTSLTPRYLLAVTDTGQAHCNIGGFAGPVAGVVPLNEWTHIACTYDRVAARLYVNGSEVASSPGTAAIPTASTALGIGKLPQVTSRNFDGLIDEVELFDRAISSAEIRAIYEAGAAGKIKPEPPEPEPVEPPLGMVSWWPGDDHPNDIMDGNHGTLQGGATYAPGMVDQAFSFDGSGSVNLGNLGVAPSEGTIDFWIKPSVVENYRNPFTTNHAGSNNAIRFEEDSAGRLYASVGNAFGKTWLPDYAFTSVLTPNVWYHVALVWSGDGSDLKGYLDGVERFSTDSNPYFPTNFPDAKIGAGYSTSPERFWKGLIDEVEFFDRALSADEIRAIYEAGPAGKIKP